MQSAIDFLENLHGNTVTIIVAIIGLIGLFSVYFMKKRDAKRSFEVDKVAAINREFSKAATEFKQAFSKIMYWLEHDAATDHSISVAGKLKDMSKVFDDAIEKFRANLPEEQISSFDSACKAFYAYDTNDPKKRKYYGYAIISDKEPEKEALKNVKALLKFAKPGKVHI